MWVDIFDTKILPVGNGHTTNDGIFNTDDSDPFNTYLDVHCELVSRELFLEALGICMSNNNKLKNTLQ